MRRSSFAVSIVLLLSGATGCSQTFGPVVRDVRGDGYGHLIVEQCNVEIGYRADSVAMVDCVKKVVDPGMHLPTAP